MKDVKYKIDKTLSTPLYLQLYNAFKNDIVSGRILDNERLPSRRRLTEVLGLGKNTVDLAYQKLIDNGYAISQPRSGYFARRQSPINTDIFEPDFYDLHGISFNMSQNGIDLPSIPKNTLVKLYREIIYDKPELFEYGHKYGEKSVRKNTTIPAWLNTFAENNNINFSEVLKDGLINIYNQKESEHNK